MLAVVGDGSFGPSPQRQMPSILAAPAQAQLRWRSPQVIGHRIAARIEGRARCEQRRLLLPPLEHAALRRRITVQLLVLLIDSLVAIRAAGRLSLR